MSGAIPPPQYAFMARYLVKHRDNFTLTKMNTFNNNRCIEGHALHVPSTAPFAKAQLLAMLALWKEIL
jgi:hypothetical protein